MEQQPATQFRVLQDNATKFQHNKELTTNRQRRLEAVPSWLHSDPGTGRCVLHSARIVLGRAKHRLLLTYGIQPLPSNPLSQRNLEFRSGAESALCIETSSDWLNATSLKVTSSAVTWRELICNSIPHLAPFRTLTLTLLSGWSSDLKTLKTPNLAALRPHSS